MKCPKCHRQMTRKATYYFRKGKGKGKKCQRWQCMHCGTKSGEGVTQAISYAMDILAGLGG